jgi:dTDP-L-rhamnose 4-epimerase
MYEMQALLERILINNMSNIFSMKILVTGGAGFIGSHLVDRLISENHEVVVIDNLEPQVHQNKKPDYLNSEAKYIFKDLSDKETLVSILKDVEIIFHQAAAVGVGQSMYEIEKYVEMNVMGTAKLLELLVNNENSVKKLVVASSMSIYGEGAYECGKCGIVYPELRSEKQMKTREWEMICPKCGMQAKPIPTKEGKPLKPTSVYAISKRDQEEMCLSVGRAYGIPTVSLRYFNVYGPRQSLSNPYTGVCAIFSSRIKNNNPPIIYEDGLQTRDFIYVDDIVSANTFAMKENKMNYKSLNVGTGKPVKIIEIANTLASLYGKDIKPKTVNKYRSGDIRHCFADVSEIKKLGFDAKTSFEEGMRKLVEWGEQAKAIDKVDEATKELIDRGLVEK